MEKDSDKKVLLEAILTPATNLSQSKKKEIASSLDLPVEKQKDLMFMSAILVSTGTNKNGATFLGSELIKARHTIVNKPLDIEHEEDKIVGHIISAVYLDFDGETIDETSLLASLEEAKVKGDSELASAIASLDKMNIEIGIVCVVYKDRFQEIAEEIEKGEWKVSMECYYDDYDLRIGSLIVKREDSKFQELDENVNKIVALKVGERSFGNHQVSRVLRGIHFCGVGIVKNPANERSIVKEAAAENSKKTLLKEDFIREAASADIELTEESQSLDIEEFSGEIVQVQAAGFFLLKNGSEVVEDSYHREYKVVAKEAIRRSNLDKDSEYTVVAAASKFINRKDIELNETSSAITYHVNEIGDIKEIHSYGEEADSKEAGAAISKWGPADNSAGICKSFERFVYEMPGRPNPGKIIATHWCKQFNRPCPVFGADAHDPSCLRNKYSRLIKVDDIHGDALIQQSFNPTIDPETTEFLTEKELPAPKGTTREAPAPVEGSGMPKPTSFPAVPPKLSNINLTNLDRASKITNLKDLTKKERSQLKDYQFALSSSRTYPIHNKEFLLYYMAMFPELAKSMKIKEQREFYGNIVKEGLRLKVDTTHFEKESNHLSAKEGGEVESYALPRLKLLPLNNREQVIAAMSRMRHLKVEISDLERDHIVVNILRAAKRFDIDANDFRKRFLN